MKTYDLKKSIAWIIDISVSPAALYLSFSDICSKFIELYLSSKFRCLPRCSISCILIAGFFTKSLLTSTASFSLSDAEWWEPVLDLLSLSSSFLSCYTLTTKAFLSCLLNFEFFAYTTYRLSSSIFLSWVKWSFYEKSKLFF